VGTRWLLVVLSLVLLCILILVLRTVRRTGNLQRSSS
jgi:cbb3-type cytochrome oxidase subunit 3